jgi:lytic murein transglycosylase
MSRARGERCLLRIVLGAVVLGVGSTPVDAANAASATSATNAASAANAADAASATSATSATSAAAPAELAGEEEFRACLPTLKAEAVREGIAGTTFDRALAGVEPDLSLLELLDRQPEFRTAIWDYLAGLVDEERVADGTAALRQHADVLAAIEARFGVDRHVVVAVWGVESNFGRNLGRRPLLQSLSTLSCFGRRQAFFRGELLATLRIVERDEIPVSGLVGSWAGAFGQTQFIPSTFQRLAVDFDGDGRRDIVASTADALASTANHLAADGWRRGEPWGYEVRLPAGVPAERIGRTQRRPLAEWGAIGVRRLDGSVPTGPARGAIIAPAGTAGPAWLVFRNFDAIYAYNRAESYALAIALLGDALAGRPGVVTPWPTDDPPLSRAERRRVQALLIERGYDLGEPDGIIGPRTREAIQDVQRQLGMEPTGRAGRRLLEALTRGDAPRAGGAPPGTASAAPNRAD